MSQYGFKAAQIATYLGPSRFLDDPALDPFWQAMSEMKVLLTSSTLTTSSRPRASRSISCTTASAIRCSRPPRSPG